MELPGVRRDQKQSVSPMGAAEEPQNILTALLFEPAAILGVQVGQVRLPLVDIPELLPQEHADADQDREAGDPKIQHEEPPWRQHQGGVGHGDESSFEDAR